MHPTGAEPKGLPACMDVPPGPDHCLWVTNSSCNNIAYCVIRNGHCDYFTMTTHTQKKKDFTDYFHCPWPVDLWAM